MSPVAALAASPWRGGAPAPPDAGAAVVVAGGETGRGTEAIVALVEGGALDVEPPQPAATSAGSMMESRSSARRSMAKSCRRPPDYRLTGSRVQRPGTTRRDPAGGS